MKNRGKFIDKRGFTMDKRYICYCGLYCENCAVKSKVEPSARVLYGEMKKAGFEGIIQFIPDGDGFWRFLKSVSEDGACLSCKEGSGNPGCAVRICAREKEVEMCPLCGSYPCDKFDEFFEAYPMLKDDNALLREKGEGEWNNMQEERMAKSYAYSDFC